MWKFTAFVTGVQVCWSLCDLGGSPARGLFDIGIAHAARYLVAVSCSKEGNPLRLGRFNMHYWSYSS